MNILHKYALDCGLKIDKPFVYENYTTVPYDKFITFYKKNYPYYYEVIKLIEPELKKRGIKILQIKANKDDVETETAILDNLTFGQWAYLIRHSMLHFGENEFLFDLCAHYDVPRVIMFSNTYPETFSPCWGSKEKERIIFELGSNKKPSLSADANLDTVRFIKPEKIAADIMSLLGVPWTAPYETVFLGPLYRPRHDIVEIIANDSGKVNVSGQVKVFVIRMDYSFNETFMANILQQIRATVITDKPVNINIATKS